MNPTLYGRLVEVWWGSVELSVWRSVCFYPYHNFCCESCGSRKMVATLDHILIYILNYIVLNYIVLY